MASPESNQQQKFRPAFTKQEIQYIIELCNLDKRPHVTEMAFTIAARLKIFALKADLHIISPAFNSTPKQSLEEKLGMAFVTPAERRAAAYEKWKHNVALCTDDELRLVGTYMYENGLMTPEQEADYERT